MSRPIVYVCPMSGELFTTCFEILRATKVKEVAFVFLRHGLKVVANAPEGDLFSQVQMNSNEFETYVLTQEQPAQFAVDLKLLLGVLKSTLKLKTFLKYPVGDNKLAVIVKNEHFISQYLLDTCEVSSQLNIQPSDRIVADLSFTDPRPLKQAIDLVAGGKNNSVVFLKLDTSERDFFKLIKEDLSVKTMAHFKQSDSIQRRMIRAFESQYSSFALKKLTAFQACAVVDMKVHEEGVLELLFTLSQDTIIKCYLPSLAKNED